MPEEMKKQEELKKKWQTILSIMFNFLRPYLGQARIVVTIIDEDMNVNEGGNVNFKEILSENKERKQMNKEEKLCEMKSVIKETGQIIHKNDSSKGVVDKDEEVDAHTITSKKQPKVANIQTKDVAPRPPPKREEKKSSGKTGYKKTVNQDTGKKGKANGDDLVQPSWMSSDPTNNRRSPSKETGVRVYLPDEDMPEDVV